jgi:hypothetical protein
MYGTIDEMAVARIMAAKLITNPRAIQWQSAWRIDRFSAWLLLASPPSFQLTLSVFCTPRALAASNLLLEQILLFKNDNGGSSDAGGMPRLTRN